MLCERFGGIDRVQLHKVLDRLFRGCLELLLTQDEAEDTDISEVVTTLQLSSEPSGPPENMPVNLGGSLSEVETAAPVYVPDLSLVNEFSALLEPRVSLPAEEVEVLARELVTKARYYFTVERKRQNVLGEGFEDLLQHLLLSIVEVPQEYIVVRKKVDTLPGFRAKTSTRERVESPDIAIVRNGVTELLASVKWSLRHDRQKQLSDELDCYVDLKSQAAFPKYVLITNEYDPGRLVNASGLNRRGRHIDTIYHINLELLLGALSDHERVSALPELIQNGRLSSIESFLRYMAQTYGRATTVA